MSITPGPGYMIDPNNPNSVIPIGSGSTVNNPNANLISGGYSATIATPSQATITRTSTAPTPTPAQVVQPQTVQQPATTNTQAQTSTQTDPAPLGSTALTAQLTQQAQSLGIQVPQSSVASGSSGSSGSSSTAPTPESATALSAPFSYAQSGANAGQQIGAPIQGGTQQTPQQIASAMQGYYSTVQGSTAPNQNPSSQIASATQTTSGNPMIDGLTSSMAPILNSLNQVISDINNPNITGQSLQTEYNSLAQQNNLPGLNSQLMNMQNIMNGTTDDIRSEITAGGGTATESQVLAMSSARNTVIMKQYNALATQYSAAQTNVSNMMQYASTDQTNALARESQTASVTEAMDSIYQNMVSMGTTMQQNAVSAAQYNISQTGYQAFAKTLQGNPQMQGYYENLLGLAPGTLSNPQSLSALDTYKQQSLQMTNLLRDTQLYNAGLINSIPQSDLTGTTGTTNTSNSQYGSATSTISQITGYSPSIPLSQANPQTLASAIISNEGSSLPGVVNNPGNIKYKGLPGQINSGVQATDGGTFASYQTPEQGQQSILSDIQAGIQNNPNQTLGQFIDKYTNTAPTNNLTSTGITTSNGPVQGAGTKALATGTLLPPYENAGSSNTSQAITAATGLTPDQFNYLVNGQSALTRMPYGRQQQLKAGVQTFLSNNGVDLSTFQSQYQAYNQTLSSNISRFNNTQIAEGEVSGTIKNLNASAINNGLSSVNITNVGQILAGKQVNDPNANEYSFYLKDLQNSLSYFYAAQQGKSASDVEDQINAAQVITGGLSNGGIQGLQNAVDQTTLKMKGVLGNAVDSAQQNVWNLFGVGSQYTKQYSDPTYQITYNGQSYNVNQNGDMTASSNQINFNNISLK